MLDPIINFLKQTDELDVAKSLLDVMTKYAGHAEEYDRLGKWYTDIKDYQQAIKYAEKALVTTPSNDGMYAARANLAKLYNHVNDPRSSLRYSKINLSINPNDYDALLEQVFSYFLLNQKDKSEAILRDIVTHPDLPENVKSRVRFNLGTYDLYKGKFREGLQGFLIEGKKIGIWKNLTLPFKFWDGGIQPGKTIIICAEGGIGDEIINVRFVERFKELGMDPIWYTTRKDLGNIFRRHGINVVYELSTCPKDSLWTYSMSVPYYLDLQPTDLWKGSYLTASQEYLDKWDYLSTPFPDKRRMVGLRWTGNPAYEQDLHREIPLDKVYELLSDKGYDIYSLQRDEGAEKAALYPDMVDLQDGLESYEDTLAIISQLDFVVTSCTSIAHASAAIGKKTYILVPITAYYTWASTLDTSSIWYGDNVVVLRQVTHGSWDEPINQLKNLLENE